MNDELYEQALKAITELFNDTSVSPAETKKQLEDLMGEIEVMINALESDK